MKDESNNGTSNTFNMGQAPYRKVGMDAEFRLLSSPTWKNFKDFNIQGVSGNLN